MKIAVFICVLACAGCVSHKQVLVKSTVFGFQVGASPTGGAIPMVQFGLVRNEYLSNPTSTNKVYAAPFNTYVNAEMAPTKQGGVEIINAGTKDKAD